MRKNTIKLENTLNDWRHKLKMEKGQFADFLGVSISLYSQWENHEKEPSLISAWSITKRIRVSGHDCHIEDLYKENQEHN